MKKNFLYNISVGAALLAMSACSMNSWNDGLDGFEGGQTYDKVTTIEYTLTNADYAAIASNATNKALAAADGLESELKLVGSQYCLTENITAQKYLPAFLGSTSFPYFALNNNSAIVLSYNVGTGLDQQCVDMPSALTYTVNDDYYMSTWGSEDNFINAFAPSHPASATLPKILKEEFPDAEAGQYAIISYNVATQEPIFGNVGGGDDDDKPNVPEGWTLSSTVATAATGATMTVNGIVTGVCKQGYILTDNSGSILVYYGSSYVLGTNNINDAVTLTGTVGSYNNGLQLTATSEETVGTWKYTYPAPTVFDGAKMQNSVLNIGSSLNLAQYVQLTGEIVISGNYVNINVDGQGSTQGSAYQITDDMKATIVSGNKYVINGYWTSVSKSGGNPKFFNILITELTPAGEAAAAPTTRGAVVEVPTVVENAVYYYNGSSWSVPANTAVLNPADYKAMGQSYNNLSAPDEYLPTYLRIKFPYAVAETSKYVVYTLYASGKSAPACEKYTYNGSEWEKNVGLVSETSQFVKVKGSWVFDPNVSITWASSRSDAEAVSYWQACSDWVYNNIDVPQYGSTSITSGIGFVTTYGNNEYYGGSSAYQCNVDLRPSAPAASTASAAKTYFANMTDAEIVARLKHNFEAEVLPGALSMIYPDADLIPGFEQDILYKITFQGYDGARTWYTATYKLTGKAKFEFVNCTWNDPVE